MNSIDVESFINRSLAEEGLVSLRLALKHTVKLGIMANDDIMPDHEIKNMMDNANNEIRTKVAVYLSENTELRDGDVQSVKELGESVMPVSSSGGVEGGNVRAKNTSPNKNDRQKLRNKFKAKICAISRYASYLAEIKGLESDKIQEIGKKYAMSTANQRPNKKYAWLRDNDKAYLEYCNNHKSQIMSKDFKFFHRSQKSDT